MTSHRTAVKGRVYYSSQPPLPVHDYWHIYLQLFMWDNYQVLLIASRLLLGTFWLLDDAIYVSVSLLNELILDFCYINLIRETGGFELLSINTLVKQAIWLTKCASHPKDFNVFCKGLTWSFYSNNKQLKAVNNCCKTFHLRSLQESWIPL